MLSRWLILMKRTHDNTRKESKSRWKENHEKWRTKDKRQHPSSLITSWPPHGNLQDWKSINNWRHMQLKNRRWIPRAHYCPSSFTERDEDWILTQPRHKTSTVVPCNVYKNKLLPHYLHYLTTTYADLAKKKWRSCSKQKGCKCYSGTPTPHKKEPWSKVWDRIVSSPSLKKEALYLINLTLLRGLRQAPSAPTSLLSHTNLILWTWTWY